MKLCLHAIAKYLLGIILVAALLFFSAGTIFWKNGWLLMILLFIPILVTGIVMFISAPELLKKRLNFNEGQKEQKSVVKLSGLIFALGFVLSGVGYRLDWYKLPVWVSCVAACAFLLGYLLYVAVLRKNMYLSRVVEIQPNQMVVDTGVYSVVRHPMYSATLLMFLSIPIVLGSVFSLGIFLCYPIVIIKRIKYEEQFLIKNLEGYCSYKEKVKYRLIPFIW